MTQFFHALEPYGDNLSFNFSATSPSSYDSIKSVFYIRDVFNIQSVGTVVGGVLSSGHLTIEQIVRVGPDSDGNYSLAKIRSLHWSRNPVESVRPGQYAAICLDFEYPTTAMTLKRVN